MAPEKRFRTVIAVLSAIAATTAVTGYDGLTASARGQATTDRVQLQAALLPNVAIAGIVKPAGNVTARLIGTNVPGLGQVVTDANGWILYRFDKDTKSPPTSNCIDLCATIWPPVLAGPRLQLTGIRAGKVGTVLRADGGRQITIGGWPVYRFIGDLTPGQWNGQRLGGVWFVVTKSGKRNLKQNYLCLPGATPTAGSPSSGATLPGGATLPSIPLPGVSAPAPTPSGGY